MANDVNFYTLLETIMRGNIIMWNGEKGIVAAEGQRYDFDINTWKGDVAPKADMPVEFTMADGILSAVNPIASADLTKEKMNKIGGEGSKIAKGIFDSVGMDVAIAYGAFALVALFFAFMSGTGPYKSLSLGMAGTINASGGMTSPSNGGFGLLVVLVSIATIVVPYFWKEKFAPLAFVVPLLVTLYAAFKVYQINAPIRDMAKQLGAMGGGYGRALASSGFSLSIGAYLAIAIAVYLAYRGITRYLNAAK